MLLPGHVGKALRTVFASKNLISHRRSDCIASRRRKFCDGKPAIFTAGSPLSEK
jgi:hypothetical protein